MAKVKIKPFFYLILGRDGDGKLTFDVYDIADEGGIQLKKISNDNGLLKYEDRTENIDEYIKPLVDDIADVYSRMGRIVISYMGDVTHSESVKKTVNEFNKEHKEDKDKPVFLFYELKGNFSLGELVKKINYHLESAAEKINSAKFDFSQAQNMFENVFPDFDSNEFFNHMMEKNVDPKKIKNIVEKYRATAPEKREEFINKEILTLPLNNNEVSMFHAYLMEMVTSKEITEEIAEINNNFVSYKFDIKEYVEQSEFLHYVDSQKDNLDAFIEMLVSLTDMYNELIEESQNTINKDKSVLKSKLKNDISKKINDAVKNKLVTSIGNSYEKHIKNTIQVYTNIKEGEEVESFRIKAASQTAIYKYSECINKFFKPEVMLNVELFNSVIFHIIHSSIKEVFPDSEIITAEQFNSRYPFINEDIKKSAGKILELKYRESEIVDKVITKSTLLHKNEFSVDVLKNGHYKINSIENWKAKIKSTVYSGYSKTDIVNKFLSLMVQRAAAYEENVISSILSTLPESGENRDIRAEIEKKAEFEKERQKARLLYSSLIDTQREISDIRNTYTNSVSSGKEV